jgi:hypothetical protein
MSLRETRVHRVSRMVDGARDPSGYNRSRAFGTAPMGHLRPNSRLTFQSNAQGRSP